MCAMTATEYSITRTSDTTRQHGRAKSKLLKILSRYYTIASARQGTLRLLLTKLSLKLRY